MDEQTIELDEPRVANPSSREGNRVLQGSAILLFSTTVVAGINLIYNVSIARLLGAAGFGHATAVYTLLMLSSAATLSFQLVCSKYIARASEISAQAALYQHLLRRGWQVGLALALIVAMASVPVARYLNLPSPLYIVLFACSAAVYIPLGVRRGRMQGCYDFRHLALNVMVEASVKLVLAIMLVFAGMGVTGAIVSMMVSVWVAYLIAQPDRMYSQEYPQISASLFREGLQAAVFFSGQVVISNLDILLVKHYFTASTAGVYADVALVGRVVYMLAWSVVSSMFPASASSEHEHASRSVLRMSLLLVTSVTAAFVLTLWVLPESLWTFILGRQFLLPLDSSFSTLLTLYAGMTAIYSVAVVLTTYEMSRRIGLGGWVQFAASAAVALGIVRFHHSLEQVILVQLFVMAGLLLLVSVPLWTQRYSAIEDGPLPTLSRIRPVEEVEVIAEFLKGEFYHREFDRYRATFRSLVQSPRLENDWENKIRRQLLFRRRGKLWREIPAGTRWWEIELSFEDLARLRAFPRNDWRRYASGDFRLMNLVPQIRKRMNTFARDPFLAKIESVQADLQQSRVPRSVILIGEDPNSALTIIEGNHRMTAAMLTDPASANRQFRFYCGFSPAMKTCCWYQTDLRSLSRYAWNRTRHIFDDRDGALCQLLSVPEIPSQPATDESECA